MLSLYGGCISVLNLAREERALSVRRDGASCQPGPIGSGVLRPNCKQQRRVAVWCTVHSTHSHHARTRKPQCVNSLGNAKHTYIHTLSGKRGGRRWNARGFKIMLPVPIFCFMSEREIGSKFTSCSLSERTHAPALTFFLPTCSCSLCTYRYIHK